MSCSKPSGKKAMQEVCDCYSTLLTREYITKKDIRYVEDSCVDIPVKLTTLFRSKLTTLSSGEKVFILSGEV